MTQNFTPIPPGHLVGLLASRDQDAAINMHQQFRTNFMAAETYRQQGSLTAARFAARIADARLEDLERIVMAPFMAEGPEIEADLYRKAQAGRVQS
ncbi:hypothetical protein CFR75_14840 [Komagataeibacter xylinus]|uniref:Uncharacterized protein n=1 Tax=Komagataeibacter xylinus TaxID=28448 RepID=A0A318PEZ3_KOMXY|nr:hypothetical protein [Komagataeibacter xylinus]PYD55729.1 hypothetical protein CFR75_14840 [Komagataeibacter xylinus]GBQ75356.1 hypothetical protein AA15237_2067 [Komagataeibacter xylinus NBRC 15237]